MMVIVDSPPTHLKDQQAKEEAVVCIHQLERTGQASWDQNDPVVMMMCQEDPMEEEEEPSISMIAKMNQIEGSMLFSPRVSNRRISLVEEAIIIETLNRGR